MNIDEDELAVWAKGPGQTEQDKCDNAVAVVRKAIDANDELADMGVEVFPHGSYRGRTNTRQNSDVDVCVCHRTIFFPSYPDGKTAEDYGIVDGSISYANFKNLVERALVDHFGQQSVKRGNKAFDIHENTYRVDADVVAAFKHRRYASDGSDSWIEPEGIGFIPDNGGGVIKNWPEQTYNNGVSKNTDTGKRYKSVIRILKHIRDEMQENSISAANDVASFLIESLVWNSPPSCFGNTFYWEDIRDVITYTYNRTKEEEKCKEWGEVNELKYLFRPSQSWSREQANSFLLAAWRYLDLE